MKNFLDSTNRGEKNNFLIPLAYILGIALPFVLVYFLPIYHVTDTFLFSRWGDCLAAGTVYMDCPPKVPNYPSIGILASGGVIAAIKSLLGISEKTEAIYYFRFYLAFVDALNFLLLTYLARILKFKRPVIIGFSITLVLFLWAAGSLWGQIDNVGLLFCLLATIAFFQSWSEKNTLLKNILWFLLGMFSLVLFILTKQLFIFSLPFFALVILTTGYKFQQRYQTKGLIWLGATLLLSLGFFLYLDSLFAVPLRLIQSSFLFVLKSGSGHGDKISGNGFNIWIFLGLEPRASSRVPFMDLQLGSWKKGISPYQAGLLLYAGFMGFLLCTGLIKIWQILRTKTEAISPKHNPTYLMVLLCLFHGLSYLGFNILLSGTHQRYLYIGYPFILISIIWLYYQDFLISRRALLASLFAAFAYACFLYSQVSNAYVVQAQQYLDFQQPPNVPLLPKFFFIFERHQFLGAVHLFLLVFLVDIWQQLSKRQIMLPSSDNIVISNKYDAREK